MDKGRLEAFSDGVFAILITILVLELKVPHGVDLAALVPLAPVFFIYTLSFIYIGIYWNNHHHLLQASHHVSGGVLWANLFLLFWISLIPFTGGWMGENGFAAVPVASYGAVLWLAGLGYFILSRLLVRIHGNESTLAKSIGRDHKGLASLVIYSLAIPLAFFNSWLAFVLYVVVALIWLIPDRRIEKNIPAHEH